jgi:hypothetical protein
MKTQWYKAGPKETFGRHKVIKNSVDDSLELNSPKGFIWEYSSTHYKACILSHTVANKYAPRPERVHKGEEVLVLFPKSDLDLWIRRLGIKNNRTSMLLRAEQFGKPVPSDCGKPRKKGK